VSFRRRTFPELVNNLLTSVTRGVAGEPQPFPPASGGPPFRFSLTQPPVADIISAHGSRDGEPHEFRKNVDYALQPDKQTVLWLEGGDLPDEGSLVNINYYPSASQPVLTDIQTGSVVRTLLESMAREIAQLYAQLETVYDSGFIDTATGKALDNVVSLLGMERIRGGRPAGPVEFTRTPGTKGAINIPAGTRIINSDGSIEYETLESVTLSEGQNTIRSTARDLEQNDPLPAGALTILPIPIAGISNVTNPAPTAIATQDESDDALRTRAKSFLHGSERATPGALLNAITRQGITAELTEPAAHPGVVELTPHAEELTPELQERLLRAIEESRPAGVRVLLKGAQTPEKVNLQLRITTRSGLLEQDLRGAQRTVKDKLAEYFNALPAKDPASLTKIIGLVLSVPEIEDVRVLSATLASTGEDVLDAAAGQIKIGGFPARLGEVQIADANLPAVLSVTATAPDGNAPVDVPKIRTAVQAAVTYLNALNASELADNAPESEKAKRVLSYGRLLQAIPLPISVAGLPRTLEAYDSASPQPGLPDENTIAPYQVRFVVTLESGLARVLSKASDTPFQLTPFQRLSVGEVSS
jgi:hypothetical protein